MDNTNTSRALVAADHLVGNLWFTLDAVPLIAAHLDPDIMRMIAPGPAAMAYSEMCRLMRSPAEQLSAGALEAGLRAQNFNFGWLTELQQRIGAEGVDILHQYAAEVNNAAALRKIQMQCAEAARAAQADDARAEVVAAELVTKLSVSAQAATNVEHISQVAGRVRSRLKTVREGTDKQGLRTGFKALDRLFQMERGDLIIVGGRPSQGKTTLWQQVFLNVAERIVDTGDDGQVVMFSADDTSEKIMTALACAKVLVDQKRLMNRTATDKEWNLVEQGIAHIESLPIYIDETSGPTIDTMYYRCAMLNAQKPVRLAGMDYMELIRHEKIRDDLQKVEASATGAKGIGRTLGFPFLMLSQLRKDVDNRADKWPTASDVRYAGEAEADKMLLIMRPEHYIARGESVDCDEKDREGIALVNVAKNKRGDVGLVRLAFKKEFARFADLAMEV
jgi:replicative DNA helicase